MFYSTEVLRSNLCDYNDACILGKSDIITAACNNPIQVAFRNCVLFTKYIKKTDGPAIDDVKDLDLFMPTYNLIEYSSNS